MRQHARSAPRIPPRALGSVAPPARAAREVRGRAAVGPRRDRTRGARLASRRRPSHARRVQRFFRRRAGARLVVTRRRSARARSVPSCAPRPPSNLPLPPRSIPRFLRDARGRLARLLRRLLGVEAAPERLPRRPPERMRGVLLRADVHVPREFDQDAPAGAPGRGGGQEGRLPRALPRALPRLRHRHPRLRPGHGRVHGDVRGAEVDRAVPAPSPPRARRWRDRSSPPPATPSSRRCR